MHLKFYFALCTTLAVSIDYARSNVDCGCESLDFDTLVNWIDKFSSTFRLTNVTVQELLQLRNENVTKNDLETLQTLLQVEITSSYSKNVNVTFVSLVDQASRIVDVIVAIKQTDNNNWSKAVVTAVLQQFKQTIIVWADGFHGTVHSVPADLCAAGSSACRTIVDTRSMTAATKTITWTDNTGIGYVYANVSVRTTETSCVAVSSQPSVCTPYICAHGGNCTNQFGLDGKPAYASCSCEAGFDGENCQLTKMAFAKGSYAVFDGFGFCESAQTHVTFRMRTTNSSAPLLYNGPLFSSTKPSSYFALTLENGNLTVHAPFVLNGRITFQYNLADNLWHRVDVTLVGDSMIVTLDRCLYGERTACQWYSAVNVSLLRSADLSIQPVVLGKVDMEPYSSWVLNGDIRNLRVNGIQYDLDGNQIFSTQASTDFCICEINQTCDENEKCVCKAGLQESCDKDSDAWRFYNSSAVTWNFTNSDNSANLIILKETTITFQFRNRASDSELLSSLATGSDSGFPNLVCFTCYFKLSIIKGNLVLAYKLSDQFTREFNFGSVRHDVGWHSLSLSRISGTMEVIADNSFTNAYFYSDGLSDTNYFSVLLNLMIAGGWSSGVNESYDYTNMRDFRARNLLQPSSSAINLSFGSAVNGNVIISASLNQVDTDPQSYDCADDQCSSSETCVETWPSPLCTCYPNVNYNHPNITCGVSHPCALNPESACNNGKCLFDIVGTTQGSLGNYSCQCSANYFGEYCQYVMPTAVTTDQTEQTVVLLASGLSTATIILIVFLSIIALLLLILLIVIIIACFEKKKAKKKVTNQPDTSLNVYIEREQQVDDDNNEGCPAKDNYTFNMEFLSRAVMVTNNMQETPIAFPPEKEIVAQQTRQTAYALNNRALSNTSIPFAAKAPSDLDSVKKFGSNSDRHMAKDDDVVTLSTLASETTDASQGFEFLDDWGPKFGNIANAYRNAGYIDDEYDQSVASQQSEV